MWPVTVQAKMHVEPAAQDGLLAVGNSLDWIIFDFDPAGGEFKIRLKKVTIFGQFLGHFWPFFGQNYAKISKIRLKSDFLAIFSVKNSLASGLA